MHNNVAHCWFQTVLKKQISIALRIYLSIAIILSPVFLINKANAANLGGWSVGGGTASGASVVYNATKQVVLNGVTKVATGVATITPTAAQVSKSLAGGAATVALDLALQALLGAVDYVLDPANNSVSYQKSMSDGDRSTVNGISLNSLCATQFNGKRDSYLEGYSFSYSYMRNGQYFCTGKERNYNTMEEYGSSTRALSLSGTVVVNPNTNETKSIPLSTVAQEVINQAAQGNATAQQAVRAAADTIVAEAETDSTKARPIIQQLEASSTIPTSQSSSGTSTSTSTSTTATGETTTTDTATDLSLEFPVFCDWAPTLCLAANVVINKPAEWAADIKAAYDDAVDYFKNDDDPDDDDDPIQITELETPVLDTSTFSASPGCPSPIPVPLNFGSSPGTIEISYEPICQFAEKWSFVAPMIGFLSGAMIIIGVGRKGEDSGL